jgi:hypothetical protein
MEGKIETTGRQGRRLKQLLDNLEKKKRVLEVERGSNRSQSLKNSLWKGL